MGGCARAPQLSQGVSGTKMLQSVKGGDWRLSDGIGTVTTVASVTGNTLRGWKQSGPRQIQRGGPHEAVKGPAAHAWRRPTGLWHAGAVPANHRLNLTGRPVTRLARSASRAPARPAG